MSPTPQESFGNFDLIKRSKLSFTDVEVSKWRSRVTGLSVIHVDYDAPIVSGYFVVGTEIFNDSGCPHTLEHLVFMGSQKYPFKGIIDHLANRAFSNGTNAWTDTDHTCYTAATAGADGFLQLLPIYVDHILYPTMTKAGYVTEVHHINSKGEDSGVVYSEMQGRENTSGDLMSLCSQRLLDPPGNAYRSETGGLMAAIRVLTVDQIREYHASYYVPHNLSLIVAGKLTGGTSSLLKVVQDQVEPRIVKHGQDKGPRPPGWKRPFVETPSAIRPPIKQVTKTIEFPERDESLGEIVITYLGPPTNDFLDRKALDVISTYLTSSATAPLNKEYVEIESPLCTYIWFSEEVRATRTHLPIYIGSVPSEHLDGFEGKLRASFKKIVDDGIDMERMAMVINREERQLRSKLESSKGDTFSSTIITDCLYGAVDGSELESSMDEINQYAEVRKWTSKQWTDAIQKYFIDQDSVVVIGKPSANLVEKLEHEEKARIAAQVAKLGPEGLKAAEKELEEAKAEHDKQIPTKILTDFPIPSVKSIGWIPVKTVQQTGTGRTPAKFGANNELAKHIESDGSEPPFFVQYNHVESDFVTIHGLFSLANLPDRLRAPASAYIAAFFSLPVKRASGEVLSHEDVVNRLDDETVSYEATLGINNLFAESMRVTIKVETAAYESAVAWLKDLVYGAQFDVDRLKVAIAKIQQSLPEMKRDGNTVLSSVWSDLVFDESSTSRAGGIITQMDYIPKIAQDLKDNPDKVVRDFEEIRSILTQPGGIRFGVTGQILGVQNPRSVWTKHFSSLPEAKLDSVPLSAGCLSDIGRTPSKKAIVVALPTIESSFTTHSAKGVQGFGHPEYPALRVTLEVLNATESYLWRYIRGSGLAYGASVSLDQESGLLSFSLYRSSNSLDAFSEAAKVIKGLVDKSVVLEDTTLDAAKSSIVFNIANSLSTVGRTATIAFINEALKGIPSNYHEELLEKFQSVTKDDVLRALEKYFLPLFDPASSVAVIVTAPGKSDETAEGLRAVGFDVEQRTLDIDPDELGSDGEGSSGSSMSE